MDEKRTPEAPGEQGWTVGGLLDWTARYLPAPRVLDVGTGSGNLAVTVAHQHKGARVTAVDVSPAALAVAARNAAKHGVAERVRFLTGDLFTPLAADDRFDFVLSNPPY